MISDGSDIPDHFQVVHLDLAREAGQPQGSANDRYTLLLPLGPDGRILQAAALEHPEYCRVSRMAPDGGIARGLMRPGPGDDWRFDFGGSEEAGFRFGEERFVPGEHVTVLRGRDRFTYEVIVLQAL
ncbi:MAG TPA: hypothetical protein VGM25_05095 [Caulobacteraceae bacterium]|jgi:hypothetical protein